MGGYESDAGSRRSGYESDAGRERRGRRSRRDRSPGPPVTTRGFMDERIRDGVSYVSAETGSSVVSRSSGPRARSRSTAVLDRTPRASDSGRDIEDDSRGLLYSVDKAERKWRASIAPTEVSIPTSRNRAPSLASTSRNSDMRSDISRLTERAKGLQLVDKSRAERFVLEDEACKEEEHNRLRKLKQDRKFDNERRDSERGIITPTPSDYSGRSEYLRPIDLGESFDGTDPIIDNLMAGKARSNASNSTYSKASSKSNRLRVPRSSHGGSTILSASGSRRPPSMHSQSHHSSNSRALVPGPPPSHHSIESAPSQAVSRRTLRRVPRKIYDDSDSEDDRRRRPAPLPTSSTNITIINTINSRR